jgi:hypothetical protein
LDFRAVEIGLLHKEAVCESMKGIGQKQGGPTRVRRLVAEAGKDVAKAVRDIAVMGAGEAAKRAIWG